MRNHKFRFSDMIPNAWFYKLKEIGGASRPNLSVPTKTLTTHLHLPRPPNTNNHPLLLPTLVPENLTISLDNSNPTMPTSSIPLHRRLRFYRYQSPRESQQNNSNQEENKRVPGPPPSSSAPPPSAAAATQRRNLSGQNPILLQNSPPHPPTPPLISELTKSSLPKHPNTSSTTS
uniref:DNA-binding domain-containing protein n=1 Tax=Cucumis melo TaxID=3656 RepID=A0A9I9DX39_CUCME